METQTKVPNVDVIDEHFYIPQLDRHRRIWVYRPTDYYYTEKNYTVIYMHDGQNLFDEATAFGDEWAIDKTLNAMLAECIIVGIDNSEKRLTEYNYNDSEYGVGEGKQYMDFIITTLKPFIDKNFRTNTRREHTHIAGSSMGGLISLYGAMNYPEVFGGAGIFSPSFWLTPNAAEELKPLAERNANYPQRFYFYGGAQEGENMLEHIASVAGMLEHYKHYDVHAEVDAEGTHSEFCWRNKFPDYYSWLAQGFPPTDQPMEQNNAGK